MRSTQVGFGIVIFQSDLDKIREAREAREKAARDAEKKTLRENLKQDLSVCGVDRPKMKV